MIFYLSGQVDKDWHLTWKGFESSCGVLLRNFIISYCPSKHTHGMLDFTPQEEREMPFDYKLLVTFGESKKDEDNQKFTTLYY